LSIICNHIDKTFKTGLGGKTVHAVTDVSFEVSPGEVFGIVGPNGAGKSTLLKMFMGFLRPSSGEITLFGKSPSDPLSRMNLGYLSENPCFYEHLSAIELMQFSARVSGVDSKKTKNKISRLLKLMNLEHAGKRKLRGYSKGMVQRAGICFALIHDPDLIVLDEPMSGLDPIGRKLLVDLVLDLKSKGKTILFCSHILNDVERLCDRIAIMCNGGLKYILSHENLIEQGKQVTLSVSNLTREGSEKIGSTGAILKVEENQTIIFCSQKQLKNIMNITAAYGIKTSNIDVSSNTLEQLFLDAISVDVVEEVCHV